LISASTCAAAVPPWDAGGPAGADAAAGAVVVAVTGGRAGIREDTGVAEDARRDAPALALGARLAGRTDGSFTTAGGAATATSAGVAAQGAAVVPHPIAVAAGLALVRPAAGLAENAPRAR
jgi:hypothetical protein